MPTSYLHLLYQALATPGGIVLRVSDVIKARQKLYSERRAARNPALDAITISVSRENPETELWLMNRSTPDASEEQETANAGDASSV